MSPTSRGPLKTAFFASIVALAGLLLLYLMMQVLLSAVGWHVPGVYTHSGERVDNRSAGAHGGSFAGPLDAVLYHPDFEVSWVVNEDGFRERPRAPKQPGEYRVGLLGDSLTAGWGVERSERFPDVWFDQEAPSLPEVTTWNLGCSHTGTHHLADVLEGIGADYELDEIVLALYSGNEIRDNLRWRRRQEGRKARSSRGGGLRNVLRDDRVALFLWLHGVAAAARGVDERQLVEVNPSDEEWAETRAALDRFDEATGDRPWTLWYVPARLEWDDAHWAEARSALGIEDEATRTGMLRRVTAWALGHGVPFVDLTPALRGRSETTVRFPNDGHYTAEGNRLLADVLANSGRAITRIPPSPSDSSGPPWPRLRAR